MDNRRRNAEIQAHARKNAMWITVDKSGDNCGKAVDKCWKTLKRNCNICGGIMKFVKVYAFSLLEHESEYLRIFLRKEDGRRGYAQEGSREAGQGSDADGDDAMLGGAVLCGGRQCGEDVCG